MNKSPFERSLLKIKLSDEQTYPTEKHLRRIIDSLNIKKNP